MEEKESDPTCSNCKQSICAANFATHSAFCERNIRVCKICKEPVRIADEKKHREEYHVRVTCEDCGLPLEKWMLFEHKEMCSRRLIPCEFCEAEFRFDEYSSHLEFCSTKTEKCMLCKKYVMLKDKKKHTELHLDEKKILSETINDEVEQNVINEAISLQGVSKSNISPEKIEDRYPSCLKSVGVMASHIDNHSNPKGFTETDGACASENLTKTSRHYGDCPICKQKIPWIDMNVHIPNCADEAGKCSRCGEDVPNSEIKEHILKTCKKLATKSNLEDSLNTAISSRNEGYSLHERTKSMYNCPFCKQPCSDDRILEHMQNCPENYWECPLCGERVPEKDKDVHGSMTCTVLCDSKLESFNDISNYTAEGNARKDKSKKFSKKITSKNKIVVPDPDTTIIICELCQEEYDAELKDVHLQFCRPLRCNSNISKHAASANAYEDRYKKSSENCSGKKRNPVSKPDTTTTFCEFCHTEYDSEVINIHLRLCRRINGDKNGPEMDTNSYAGAAKKNLKITPTSQTLEQNKSSAEYCTCLNCDEIILKKRMQNHLLVCRRNRRRPCVYCKDEISVSEEEVHLEVCKVLNASQNSSQVPDNRNVNKGVIPKNSKFAQMVRVKTAKCSYCETTLNDDILLYHESECVHKPILCDKCCTPIKIKDLETHACKSGKAKKGKHGGNMKKEEKSDTGFGIKKCLKNLFTYSEQEVNDRSKKEKNEPAYRSQDYNSYIQDFNRYPYNYSYGNFEYSYPNRNIHNEYNNSYVDVEATIPCEFCGKPFPVSEIILHSTGCDPELTKCFKTPASENVKESKSSSNKTNNADLSDAANVRDFFSGRQERNLYSTRLNNKNCMERTIRPGEFLQDKFNMNASSEPLPNKPDIVKESENSTKSRHSNIQSVWNMNSPEIGNEAVEIFPRDSPAEEKFPDKTDDEMEVSDVTQEIPEDKHVETDDEMSDMLNFIMDEKVDASDENSSVSSEDDDLKPEKQRQSALEKNKVPLDTTRYKKAYELLNESKNVSVNENEAAENQLTNFVLEGSVHHKKAFTIEPALKFPLSGHLEEKDKFFAKKFEMQCKQILENTNSLLQMHHLTKKGDAEKPEDDILKWKKWRSCEPNDND